MRLIEVLSSVSFSVWSLEGARCVFSYFSDRDFSHVLTVSRMTRYEVTMMKAGSPTHTIKMNIM